MLGIVISPTSQMGRCRSMDEPVYCIVIEYNKPLQQLTSQDMNFFFLFLDIDLLTGVRKSYLYMYVCIYKLRKDLKPMDESFLELKRT